MNNLEMKERGAPWTKPDSVTISAPARRRVLAAIGGPRSGEQRKPNDHIFVDAAALLTGRTLNIIDYNAGALDDASQSKCSNRRFLLARSANKASQKLSSFERGDVT